MQAAASDQNETAPDEVLETLIGYNLKRAYMVVHEDFRRVLGENGLTPRSFSALSLIADIPNVTQSEISRRLGIERSGMVAIIDDLQKRGYAERKPVPGDRRVQALALTAEGAEVFRAASRAAQSHEARLLSVLNEEERQTLLTLLRKLRDLGEAP